MIFLTEEKELILKGDFIMYFYAGWMPFYNKMLTMLTKIEEKYKDKIFYSIDVDYFKILCKKYNIVSVPTIILFRENREKTRVNGVVLTSALKNVFHRIYLVDKESNNGKDSNETTGGSGNKTSY
jgi:thioredoxin-like negative regulator of GroEL